MYERNRLPTNAADKPLAQVQRNQCGTHLCGHSRAISSHQAGNHNTARARQTLRAKRGTHAQQLFEGNTQRTEAKEDYASTVLQGNEHCQASTAALRQTEEGTTVRQEHE